MVWSWGSRRKRKRFGKKWNVLADEFLAADAFQDMFQESSDAGGGEIVVVG